MGLFLKKKNLFFAIISSFFVLILFYFISVEFYFEKYLFRLGPLSKFLFFYFLVFIYLFPIIIFIFFKLINNPKRRFRYIYYFFSSIYYMLLIFLVFYLSKSRLVFDFNLFMYNIGEVLLVVIGTVGIYSFIFYIFFYIFFIFSMIIFFENIKVPKFENKASKIFRFVLLTIILCFSLVMGLKLENKNPVIIKFLNRVFARNDFVKDYDKKYREVFNYYSTIDSQDFELREKLDKDSPDIYFIHLESVNNELINKKTTPELIKYSDKYGVRFINFFSNTIQTLRAEESILCAMPPSLGRYLNNTYDAEKIVCLPKIFNNLGYQTFFFKSYKLSSTGTGDFMKKIGFNEIHNSDIMEDDDLMLPWGYREDVFYDRVWKNLKSKKSDNKFVYIAVSSSNHYPFSTSHFVGQLPFVVKEQSTQDDFIKQLSNSTYIQDIYFGQLIDRLVKDKKKKYIFIYSDNAWPVGIHENNILNESMAYKENFSIPFVFISVGDDNFKKSEIVEEYYGQSDIFSTVLDLFNIRSKKKYLSNSFYNQLKKVAITQNNRDKCILSIQPFSDRFFSFIKDNMHYIYNIFTKEFIYYDLEQDADELYPRVADNFEEIYRYCTFFKEDID